MRLDRAHFGASAARNMPKTMRFHAFSELFIVLGSSQHLFFFVCFFEKFAKTTRFHAFFEIRPQTSCSMRGSGSSLSALPELRCGFNASILGLQGLTSAFLWACFNKNVAKSEHFCTFSGARGLGMLTILSPILHPVLQHVPKTTLFKHFQRFLAVPTLPEFCMA